MEPSHHSSDLDPSSVLGFGSALAMLDSADEVGRLLTGALRSMGLADLQAVVLAGPSGQAPRVEGSRGTQPLSAPLCEELREITQSFSVDVEKTGTPSRHRIEVCPEKHPALTRAGIQRLSLIRLGSIDRDFGLLVVGHTDETGASAMDGSTLEMMGAQASMALHRIQLDRQRKNKEEALRKSETRYRDLYESAPVAYVSAAPDGEIRMMNERATELLGAPREALIGRSMPHLCLQMPDETGTAAAQQLEHHLRDGGPLRDTEVQLCRADGEQVWVSLTMRSIESPDGGIERLVMMIDITERKRMETALREAHDELETRVEERTAELQEANDRLKRQTKRLEALREVDRVILAAESPHEIATVAARRAQDIVPCERVSVSVLDWDEGQAQVLTTDQNLAADREHHLLDSGTTIPLDAYFMPDALRDGEAAVIPDLDDISLTGTAKKIREKGIRSVLFLPMRVEETLIGVLKMGRSRPDAFAEDDRRVGQELADHLAIALRQAQLLEEVQVQRERLEERVQERTAELESFTYSVSHDLRTPLRAIDGYTRILREEHADQLDDEGKRLLNVVYDSAQTMGDLIDDLLTLSRLGRREMNRVRIGMEALVQEVHTDLCRSHPNAEAADCKIGTLPQALGDRSMIRQVVTNLLSNALKFTRNEETPRIEVGAEERDGKTVYFVQDNGVGFDMEYADKLFGVFERLHDENTFEGTGVGLAIVERIVRRHGGEVWGEGAEDDGATIFFTLPKPPNADE